MEVDEVVAVLFVMLDELEVVDFVLVLVSVADEVVVVEVVIAVLLLVKSNIIIIIILLPEVLKMKLKNLPGPGRWSTTDWRQRRRRRSAGGGAGRSLLPVAR